MRPLSLTALLVLLIAAATDANQSATRALQSGSVSGPRSIHDRGIHGEGQILAILDTGLDYDSCYFSEVNGAPPPENSASPSGLLQTSNVDLSRRKVIAYDFLYSCMQYPGAPGCETPGDPLDYDNQGHGTHAAGSSVADKAPFGVHDFADAIAPMTKLVVQDAGYIGGDNCSQRPGLGCPITTLPAVLQQSYTQGARIHSNSWGDRQGIPPTQIPPTGNYSAVARDIDQFASTHPEMLIVFNTGNAGALGTTSLSAPGVAKNTLQVGGMSHSSSGDYVVGFSGYGPSRDGRIKPDLVAPAQITAGGSDFDVTTGNCNTFREGGTSWSAPVVAGAAALVRQYYTDGFYPTGQSVPANRLTPTSALIKATLIASSRRVPYSETGGSKVRSEEVPNFVQGFGIPVLDDALHFAGESGRMFVHDSAIALAPGETFRKRLMVRSGRPLRIALVWIDPAGTPAGFLDTTRQLVNDLDLRVIAPDGATSYGNERLHPGEPDRLNNVEVVRKDAPAAGLYEIAVDGRDLRSGTQKFALVILGDFDEVATRERAARRR